LTSNVPRKSFPPIRLRTVKNKELDILLGPKEGRKGIYSNRSIQRGALIYLFMPLGAPGEGRGNTKRNEHQK